MTPGVVGGEWGHQSEGSHDLMQRLPVKGIPELVVQLDAGGCKDYKGRWMEAGEDP